jgi:hypothetical protein
MRIRDIILELGIDVPISAIEEKDGQVTLYLYGGTVKHWPPQVAVHVSPAQAPALPRTRKKKSAPVISDDTAHLLPDGKRKPSRKPAHKPEEH